MTDDTILELSRLYRAAEAKVKAGQLGELFVLTAATLAIGASAAVADTIKPVCWEENRGGQVERHCSVNGADPANKPQRGPAVAQDYEPQRVPRPLPYYGPPAGPPQAYCGPHPVYGNIPCRPAWSAPPGPWWNGPPPLYRGYAAPLVLRFGPFGVVIP